MTNLAEDPLYVILRSKRESTRFQILVEIAEHQPSIRQQEIAGKLGVTPQAISEYTREMVDEGLVTAHGRGRYEVTKSGIEWVLRHAEALESYARQSTGTSSSRLPSGRPSPARISEKGIQSAS